MTTNTMGRDEAVEVLRNLRDSSQRVGSESICPKWASSEFAREVAALDVALAALQAQGEPVAWRVPTPYGVGYNFASESVMRDLHSWIGESFDVAHPAPQKPAPVEPVGVEAYLVERLDGTGYGRARSIVDAAIYNPTEPAFWVDPEARARHRVTPLVPALAQQPAAVDDAAVEEANEQRAIAAYGKYMGVSADDPAYGPDLTQWMAGWNAALATQHQEPTT